MATAIVALSPVREEFFNFPGYFSSFPGHGLDESILIYLAVGGSVIPMRVLESDSIASLKLQIQNLKGFLLKNQKLVYEGRELARNNSHVRDYGVGDGNVLHLVLQLSSMQSITIRTVCGKVIEFNVERNKNVAYLKQQIATKGKGFFDPRDQELIFNGEELEDQILVHEICKNSNAVIHLLIRKPAKVRASAVEKDVELSIIASDLNEEADVFHNREHHFQSQSEGLGLVLRNPLKNDFLLEPLMVNPEIELPLVVRELIVATFAGLARGNEPIMCSEGSGGAYFMQDSSGREHVSVFKPSDEEPMAVNNPRGLPLSVNGEGLKKGTRVGEGALREVAAYILDHPRDESHSLHRGFSGVPPTVMVKCWHRKLNHPEGCAFNAKNAKIGSLQMFVRNCGSCEDMGPHAFPVNEVHKISLLDIRLANADRHAGNILVTKDGDNGQIVLTPIDHGYCLPENFEDCTFDWLYWPQARQPYSPDAVEYIKSLDAERDIELLKFHGWELPQSCARVLRISTMLLKKGVERGLTPYDIGSTMCRETLKKESAIEQIIEEARDGMLAGSSEVSFMEAVSVILDRHLDMLSMNCSGVEM